MPAIPPFFKFKEGKEYEKDLQFLKEFARKINREKWLTLPEEMQVKVFSCLWCYPQFRNKWAYKAVSLDLGLTDTGTKWVSRFRDNMSTHKRKVRWEHVERLLTRLRHIYFEEEGLALKKALSEKNVALKSVNKELEKENEALKVAKINDSSRLMKRNLDLQDRIKELEETVKERDIEITQLTMNQIGDGTIKSADLIKKQARTIKSLENHISKLERQNQLLKK